MDFILQQEMRIAAEAHTSVLCLECESLKKHTKFNRLYFLRESECLGTLCAVAKHVIAFSERLTMQINLSQESFTIVICSYTAGAQRCCRRHQTAQERRLGVLLQ
jgi:hypothetical protein